MTRKFGLYYLHCTMHTRIFMPVNLDLLLFADAEPFGCSYQHRNVKTPSRSSWSNWEIGLESFRFISALLVQGQARGKWTYHLKKAQYHEGPLFLRPHCGQTSRHTWYYKVSNERYIHYLSNDIPYFDSDWTVWSQRHAKVGWFWAFSRKWQKFPSTKENFSWHLFSKYCRLVKKILTAIKPTNCNWPPISQIFIIWK